MVAPTPDSSVRLRLKCPDAEDFIGRFARNVTRGGIFLPTREARDVGSSIRFEILLVDERVVFAGEGVVTWAKPKGLGLKFTNLDPATRPMLERLLGRREGGETATASPAPSFAPSLARPAPVPADGAAKPNRAPAPTSATSTRTVPGFAPALLAPVKATAAPAKAATSPTNTAPAPLASSPPAAAADPAPVPAAPTKAFSPWTSLRAKASPAWTSLRAKASPAWTSLRAKRPSVRQVLASSVVLVWVAVIWVSIGRARLREAPAPEPARAPAVAAPAAPIAPPGPPAGATAPTLIDGPQGGLRVDSMVAAPSYKRLTCREPTQSFSVKSSKMVNVCLQITHAPTNADQVTLIWERNGAFYGKTPVKIPASRRNVRTRAHMKIGEKRLGSWSVRVVSDRNVPLARTTFEVTP